MIQPVFRENTTIQPYELGKRSLEHAYLHASFSFHAYVANLICHALLLGVLILTSLPLVVSVYIVGFCFRPGYLYPPINGVLMMKEERWHYNGAPLCSPSFTLVFSEWCIGVREQNGQRYILWRDSSSESAYRHLLVTIKKQSIPTK
ncbi:protein YgfX [Vibrio methylphosphonaticus]|uniref:protein YgfX n=1 Tax=Vibrio methylphosphonaticus TaxID=2946866 RepID=UPI0038732978